MIEFAEKNHVNPAWLIGLLQKQPQHYRLDGPTRLKFIQDLSERKTRIDGYASLCVNWKRTRSLNGKSGAFLRPICNIYNSLHFPALSDTVTIHNSGLSVYYNNLIFIMDFW
ncbi:hypothetical protein ACLK17_06925 [Escherichia coli]